MPNHRRSESSVTVAPTQPPELSEEISGEQSEAEIRSQLYLYQQRVLGLEQKLSDTDKKIEQSKDKNIETLGLFVALFTFISVEFSLFRTITDFSAAVSISFIAAGLLIFFVLILHLVIISSGNNTSWFIKGFYVFLFLIAIILVYSGINFNDYFKKNYSIIDGKSSSAPIATPSATITPLPTQ